MTRPPSPNGSRRRASSAPRASPRTTSASTSPASRRSVSSATRRRSSSSATTVTAWCRTRRSNSDRPPASLTATSQACGRPLPPALGGRDRQRERRGRRARLARARSRASRRGGRARAARRPIASTAASASSRRKVVAGQRLAAPVEDQRGAADQRGERRGDARRARARSSTIRCEALLRGDRALQHRVLLVDQARERLLGHRDERRVVGHLEEREVPLGGGLARARRAPGRGRSRRRRRGRRARGRPAGARRRAGPRACSRPMPVVSSSSPPDSHGVGSASSEMCTQRTGTSRFASPARTRDVEVAAGGPGR